MPFEVIRYHCNICKTPYRKPSEARNCELINHNRRSVSPTAADTKRAQSRNNG